MSRGALFTTPLEFDLGASWCAGVIALLKSQSLWNPSMSCKKPLFDTSSRFSAPSKYLGLTAWTNLTFVNGSMHP